MCPFIKTRIYKLVPGNKNLIRMSKIVENASERIDEAIANAEPFAQEILTRLRQLIKAADDRLIEDWKWGPSFHYKGNVVGIWGHKKHVNMLFWKGAAMPDPDHLFIDGDSPKALRTIQFRKLKEVKASQIKKYIKNAIKVLESGEKVKAEKIKIVMPAIFKTALNENKELKTYYDSLSYYQQKEFAHYIGEAKQEATKQRRLIKVMGMLKERIGLHDQYKPKK